MQAFVTLTSVSAGRSKINRAKGKSEERMKTKEEEGHFLGEIRNELRVKIMARGDKTYLFSVKIRPVWPHTGHFQPTFTWFFLCV